MSINFNKRKTLFISVLCSFLLILSALAVRYFFFSDYTLKAGQKKIVEIAEITEPLPPYVSDGKIIPQPLNIRFSESAANPALLGKNLDNDVQIHPALQGSWKWESDSRLSFTPEKVWLPGQNYKVTMSAKIFSPAVKIKDKHFSFSAPAFTGFVTDKEFYENPQDPKIKALTASFRFTYPIDTGDIDKHVSITTAGGEKYRFNYKLSDADTVLHIVSDPVKIGATADFAKITVSKIANAYNKVRLKNKLTAEIKIPDSSDFFKLTHATSSIVRNEQNNNDPEQILFLNFTTAVDIKALADKLTVYYSPLNYHDLRAKITNEPDFVKSLPKVELKPVTGDQKSAKRLMFRYHLDVHKGWLIAELKEGLKSADGFVLTPSAFDITAVAPYPLETKIAFDGSLLSLTGSRKIAFVSRGVKQIKASVARINPENLNHLATQTGGDFSHPYFKNYNFSEDNISELFEKKLQINSENPAKADYSSLDLNNYFENKKGIFLIKTRGYADDEHSSPEDARLVVLTDLGIVVKDNQDKTHDIFVSDISAGKPVAGAKVEILGKNGLPVLTARTDDKGHAFIADFSRFEKDRKAVVYKVSTDSDLSFLPVDKSDRKLNQARFDIGGEYDYADDKENLKGYVFSDRGIYRPDEEAHFGIIIRQNNLDVPQNIPLIVEISNPSGDVAAQSDLWPGAEGYLTYDFKISPSASTGQYHLNLYAKDEKNYKRYITGLSFRVEEFQPDNLKIRAKWENGNISGWFTSEQLKSSISLSNLYGNPAAGNQIRASYSLTPVHFYFKKFKGWSFRDPLRDPKKKVKPLHEDLSAVTTDQDGKAEIEIDLSQFEKGTYNLLLQLDALEKGSGRGVGAGLSALVSPMEFLIGQKADGNLEYIRKDSHHQISFIAVDHNLTPIEKTGLFKILIRKDYISTLTEAANGTFRYMMLPKETVLGKENWQIGADGATAALDTSAPGEYVLRIEDEQGRILAQTEYTVTGDSNLTHAVDKDAGLDIKLNRNEYKSGDQIEMQITAPYSGYGLITIERDKVYAYKWFNAATSSVTESIVLPPEVEGNAYINVIFFRDINSPEIYMPSLSYATVPFSINKSARSVMVSLETPQTVKPGEELKIAYKTSSNAKIIVYGVNQGILQVAGYKLPDPLANLMKKKALRVVTSQIMDLIMPDIKVLRLLSSTGGDGDLQQSLLDKNLNPFARKTDKPVAFWSGIISSGPKERVYSYKVPETFNGEIKVMAVAVSEKGFGSAEKSVLSRGDFALTPSGALNVSPDDEFVIGLTVADLAETGGEQDVAVSVDSGGNFALIGDQTQTVTLKAGGETFLKFSLKALDKLGSAEIRFKAQSLQNSQKTSTMPYSLSIRPISPYQSRFDMGHSRSKFKLSESDIENLYHEFRVQQVSASESPLVLTAGTLKYLDKFPFGCTEQSVSKIFPMMELFFKSPLLIGHADIYTVYDRMTAILHERQNLNGGFNQWGFGGSSSRPYDSVYATHFMVKADQHGFRVPAGMLKKALSYCENMASRRPDGPDDIVPAYAAYVLTLSGKTTTNYLLNLEDFYMANYPKEWHKSLNATFLAAAYKMLHNEAKAASLYGKYQYDGDNRYNAINTYLSATHFPDRFDGTNRESIEKLLEPIQSGNLTTDTAAWSTLALNAMFRDINDNGIRFSGARTQDNPFPTADFSHQAPDLTVTSDRPFFYVVTQQGFIKEKHISARHEGIEIYKSITDQNGNPVSNAAIGDVLTVRISYRSLLSDPVFDVAITDLTAGCFEVVNGSLTSSTYIDDMQIREDRVIAQVYAAKRTQEISYKVKVVAEGTFALPPAFAAALYRPLVRANSESGIITVGK